MDNTHGHGPRPSRLSRLGTLLTIAFLLVAGSAAHADLLVTRTVYTGDASTVTVGQALPGGGTAIANGSYPNVWQNEGPDPSFGVTSPIFIDHISSSGQIVSSFAVPTTVTTSFSSKSELAINLSLNGQAVTFMGYIAPPKSLDVSNSNTPGHFDPTNPVGSTFQRAVVQIDGNGTVNITPVNTYSGNNGRAAILVNGQYLMVGNAGNGSGTQPLNIVNNTGVQSTTPGGSADATVIGKQQGTQGNANGFQFGFSVTQTGAAADKSGKDDNFRGLTVFNNTLYVTKGSGSNGVDTVYQVGAVGSASTLTANSTTTAINILPGFPTGLAKTNPANMFPFGIWFANATTLYVADEGDGTGTNPNAGLQKWTFDGTKWNLQYTLQNGLKLGQQYGVPNGPNGEIYPLALDPATTGLRNLIGQVNADGTVTLYATTATNSANTDPGADPNEVVSITDLLSATTLPSNESFSVIEGPAYGVVYRGVAVVPSTFLVPEPSTLALFGLAGAALSAWRWRRAAKKK